MVTLLTVIHIVVCLFLILVVLLQAGKGGGMGIAFGGAGSQTVFGSSGAGNFLTRLTSITATIFLLTSLALAHYSSRQDSKRLQQLASQRATEKKADEEKKVKLNADLEKARAGTVASKDGGAGSAAPEGAAGATPAPSGAGTTGAELPAGATSPTTIPVKLEMPKLGASATKPAAPGVRPTAGVGAATAPGAAAPKAAAPRKPPAAKPAAPKPARQAAPAPAATPSGSPEAPAAPSE